MAITLDIDHEAGNLSEYSNTATDGGDLSVTEQAALAGTNYGLQCVLNDANSMYAQEYRVAAAIHRVRFYFDIGGITTPGNTVNIFGLSQIGGSYWNVVLSTVVYYGGSDWRLKFAVVDDNNATVFEDEEAITKGVHYVEFDLRRSASEGSSDGTVEWWIDGVSKGSYSGIDNYNLLIDRPNYYYTVGCRWPSGTWEGAIYIDQIIVNDDGSEIGPLQTGITINLDPA